MCGVVRVFEDQVILSVNNTMCLVSFVFPHHCVFISLYCFDFSMHRWGCSSVVERWPGNRKIPGSNPVSSCLPHLGRKIRCAGLQSPRKTLLSLKGDA